MSDIGIEIAIKVGSEKVEIKWFKLKELVSPHQLQNS